ncbi:MAG: glycosyl hydrolase family 18 protein [Ferruginibacter sp.]
MQRHTGSNLIMLLLSFIFSSVAFSQFKVIGYIQPRWNQVPDVSSISFQSLTHLNIAFVNPDSTGDLVLPPGFDTLVQKAHEYKLKVLASVGGGSYNPYTGALLNDSNRAAFVQRLVQFSIDHNLDGIDVDLEGEAIDKNYDHFITDLSSGLKHAHKLLTAAVATWNGESVPPSALRKFDFINVMSYDQTGPWRPNEPGPHSTFIKAEEDLHYWTATRGLSKKKINLGVPFYGWCFGTKNGQSMSYADIVANFPGSDTLDMVVPDSGGVIHYNGLTTIKKKTALALKNAGGVMIWQILQDAEGDKSLLMEIERIVKVSGKN